MIEQRSDEWFAARAGRLTASDAALIYTQPKRGSAESTTRKKLILRLALERISGPGRPSTFDTPAMQRGRELEAEGLAAYEAKTGAMLSPVGFVSSHDLLIGCSPDGAILNNAGEIVGGCEIKCPDPITHDEYRQDYSRLVSAYEAQVAHTLLVCQSHSTFWDLVSYCPEMPAPLRLVIVRLFPQKASVESVPDPVLYDVDLAAHELTVREFLREVDDKEAALRHAAQEAM